MNRHLFPSLTIPENTGKNSDAFGNLCHFTHPFQKAHSSLRSIEGAGDTIRRWNLENDNHI